MNEEPNPIAAAQSVGWFIQAYSGNAILMETYWLPPNFNYFIMKPSYWDEWMAAQGK